MRGDGIESDREGEISPVAGVSAGRQTAGISASDADRDLRSGSVHAAGPGEDRLEADHQSAGPKPQGCGGKAGLVRDALANRNLSQDSEIRLPGRSIEAANG